MRVCPNCLTRTESDICPEDGYKTVEEKFFKHKEADPLIGQIFNNRYQITELIGRGGMGAVYKAVNLAMHQTVALKVMNRELVEDITQVRRFHQEATASSRLTHPHTIKVFDFGQSEDGLLFIAMEYLEGKTLTKIVKEEGPLPWNRVQKISFQIGQTLAEAHENGIVHRDLKPDNIFLLDVIGEPDFVKVLDFGIAKFLSSGSGEVNLTKTGIIIGTPQYMSPEQARGERLDFRSDLYSLGIIMYEMLTGIPPFTGETPMSVLMAHMTKPLPEILPDIMPATAVNLILKLTAKNKEERPSSTRDFLNLLQSISQSQDDTLPLTIKIDSPLSSSEIQTGVKMHDAQTVYIPDTGAKQSVRTESKRKAETLKEDDAPFDLSQGITRFELPVKKIGISAGILSLIIIVGVLLIYGPWEEASKEVESNEGKAVWEQVILPRNIPAQEEKERRTELAKIETNTANNEKQFDPIKTPLPAKVKVNSTPRDALVYRNGQFVGKTPFEIEPNTNEIEFVFKKDGFKNYTLKTKILHGFPIFVTLEKEVIKEVISKKEQKTEKKVEKKKEKKGYETINF